MFRPKTTPEILEIHWRLFVWFKKKGKEEEGAVVCCARNVGVCMSCIIRFVGAGRKQKRDKTTSYDALEVVEEFDDGSLGRSEIVCLGEDVVVGVGKSYSVCQVNKGCLMAPRALLWVGDRLTLLLPLPLLPSLR